MSIREYLMTACRDDAPSRRARLPAPGGATSPHGGSASSRACRSRYCHRLRRSGDVAGPADVPPRRCHRPPRPGHSAPSGTHRPRRITIWAALAAIALAAGCSAATAGPHAVSRRFLRYAPCPAPRTRASDQYRTAGRRVLPDCACHLASQRGWRHLGQAWPQYRSAWSARGHG
jgi:hypothetical protein